MSTIRDVAKEAGVSTATVSRTFTTPNIKPTKTQTKVLEAARKLGYRSRHQQIGKEWSEDGSFFSPALPAGLQNMIGFQFFASGPGDSLSSNAFYGPILHGAEKEASSLGLHMLLNTTDAHASLQDLPSMVKNHIVRSMLLVGSADPQMLATISQHVPNLILVDNYDDNRNYESIVSDGFGGAYQATKYLLDLGHREEIKFLMPDYPSKTLQDRLRGFVCALFENGVESLSNKVITLPEDHQKCTDPKAAIVEFLQSSGRPTALLCGNDYYAHKVIQACWDIGLKIPDDLSVIGFDDIEFSQQSCPPLTTVRVDKEWMGRFAVRRLFERLRSEAGAQQTQQAKLLEPHVIPVSLIVRGSCRAL
ncbi:MAG: LacI family DNA-binding transcriptional regulator [Armatimonadota bacterium]